MNYLKRKLIITALVFSGFPLLNAQSVIKIDGSAPRTTVSSSLYGIFFEEISHGGEGGLYAEMIRNRSFEDNVLPGGCTLVDSFAVAPAKPDYFTGKVKNWKKKWNIDPLEAWKLLVTGNAKASVYVTDSVPLNDATPHAAFINISSVKKGEEVDFANSGFWGIGVEEGDNYNVRLFLNVSKSYKGTAFARFVSEDGKVIGEAPIKLIKTGKWNEYKFQIPAVETSHKATFRLCFDAPGQIFVDFVSVFPEETFKKRENGLRADVAQKLADLKPAFIRWPGGCIVEGLTLENRVRWKETLGDPVTRKGQYCLWGYRNTYGWGYHEYLQFCEDIGSAGMYVCNVGISCEFRNGDFCSDDSVKYFIHDAVDAIEYAIGDVSTTWGAKRAAAGHPAPFPLKFVEIGNENRGPIYYKRYNQFYKVLKARFPQIQFVLNTNFGEGKFIIDEASKEAENADLADLHWYESPEWFFNHAAMFDSIKPRPNFKLYVGEYACNKDVGAGNLYGALSEAAFIMGMERNSDLVSMTSYAPLFENSNQRNWPVNLIWMNNNQVFGRSSYYVQRMFSENRPSEIIKTSVSLPEKPVLADFSGGIGLATFNTSAEFKDISVTSGNKELYHSDFINRASDWNTVGGKWEINDSAYKQSVLDPFQLLELKDQNFSNCTIYLKARKLEGKEGFIIVFGSKDLKNRYSINIGGWSNAYSAFERVENGRSSTISNTVLTHIDNNKWYDIKIVANFPDVECYVDGKLLIKHKVEDYYKQFAQAGYDAATNEMVIKVVNAEPQQFTPQISLANVGEISTEGEVITLTSGSSRDENSFSSPMKISPVKQSFNGFSGNFSYTFKPWSFTILRVKVKK